MKTKTQLLKQLLSQDKIYLAPGVYNGLSAKLAAQADFPIIYASGGAIARSMALPDMGLISWSQITERLTEIVDAVNVPIIADFDNPQGQHIAFCKTSANGMVSHSDLDVLLFGKIQIIGVDNVFQELGMIPVKGDRCTRQDKVATSPNIFS